LWKRKLKLKRGGRRGERRGEGKDGEKAEKRKMRRRPEAEGLAVSGRRDTQSEQPMPKVATLTGSTLSEMPGSKYASLDGTNRKDEWKFRRCVE
jgi:hypothetical protein